ncbi:hypothetical protein L3Q72_18970 [Vibrio sp. JC009]|nr:hypothetical protein [Vibrio sp. JC009]WED24953.1 hypothetical protein L3Q72_18970 [Vibrio sp. JC009]
MKEKKLSLQAKRKTFATSCSERNNNKTTQGKKFYLSGTKDALKRR